MCFVNTWETPSSVKVNIKYIQNPIVSNRLIPGAIWPLNRLLWTLHVCLFQGDLDSHHPSQEWEFRVAEAVAVDPARWQPTVAWRTPATVPGLFGWQAAGKQVGGRRLICQNSWGYTTPPAARTATTRRPHAERMRGKQREGRYGRTQT